MIDRREFVAMLLGAPYAQVMSLGGLISSNLCILCWIVFLTPKGERSRVTLRSKPDPQQEKLLIDLLKALNQRVKNLARTSGD